jgi:hypothetical protein
MSPYAGQVLQLIVNSRQGRKVRSIMSFEVCQQAPSNPLNSRRGQGLLNICHLSESAGEQ